MFLFRRVRIGWVRGQRTKDFNWFVNIGSYTWLIHPLFLYAHRYKLGDPEYRGALPRRKDVEVKVTENDLG